jgi:hypothetical protein
MQLPPAASRGGLASIAARSIERYRELTRLRQE